MFEFSSKAFRREDDSPDEDFYRTPWMVTHIDDRAVAAVTQLYRNYFPSNGTILDLMSGWSSHLPPEARYRRVVGLGLNRVELAANPRLDSYLVQNLNRDATLPFPNAEFDGGAICVSVNYLTEPIMVMRELRRVLRPRAPLVITFSNRYIPTKSIAIWHSLDGHGRRNLVERCLLEASEWASIVKLTPIPEWASGDPLYAVVSRK